jgi:DNA-binding NarL/FixJ family response regulator
MPSPTAPPTLHDQIQKLSPRQMQIASLLVEGQNARQIATLLSISRVTVITHIRIACQKLEVENRIQLIVTFVKWQVAQEITHNEQR